jgi:hypothetical protein
MAYRTKPAFPQQLQQAPIRGGFRWLMKYRRWTRLCLPARLLVMPSNVLLDDLAPIALHGLPIR